MPLDFEGKAIEISFDPKFLVDMLRILEPDTALTLDLIDSQSAAVFRQEPNYLYVVVPLVATTA
jgi:DNA polymerase-3 subunit beta